MKIQHVWFDLAGTLAVHTPEWDKVHDRLRYRIFAKVLQKPLTPNIEQEYERLYTQKGSNSAVFHSLGLPSDYWQRQLRTLEEEKYLKRDRKIYGTLEQLKVLLPISLFTNNKLERVNLVLPAIGIDTKWFTTILTGDDLSAPKPALVGFETMVKISRLPADEILYVGDRVKADIEPARKVGMKTCLVWSDSTEADYSFRAFEDILTLWK